MHASVACHRKLIVEWVAAGDLEDATAIEVVGYCYFCLIFTIYTIINYIDLICVPLQAPDVYKAAWDVLKVVMLYGLIA